MTDIYLYQGQANPNDVVLRDPTTVGAQAITGTGDITSAVSAVDATGQETFAGTSDIASAVSALAASGTEVFSGSGAVASPVTALSGTAAELFAASSGDVASPVTALTAAGGEGFTATGDVASGASVIASTGLERFSGSADVTSPAPALDGSGIIDVIIVGDGAITSSPEFTAIGAVFNLVAPEALMDSDMLPLKIIGKRQRKVQPTRGTAMVRTSVTQIQATGTVGIGTREDAFWLEVEDIEEIAA